MYKEEPEQPLAQFFLQASEAVEEARCSMRWADLLVFLPAAPYRLVAFPFAALFHHLCASGRLSLTARYVVTTPAAALRASHACGCFLGALLARGAVGCMVASQVGTFVWLGCELSPVLSLCSGARSRSLRTKEPGRRLRCCERWV